MDRTDKTFVKSLVLARIKKNGEVVIAARQLNSRFRLPTYVEEHTVCNEDSKTADEFRMKILNAPRLEVRSSRLSAPWCMQ